MNCREIRERLAEDASEVRNHPEIAAHLETCDSCRAFAEKLRQADDALRGLESPRPDPALVEATLERVRSRQRSAARRPRRLRLAWAFATGSLLVLVGGSLFLFSGRMRELAGTSANALAGNELASPVSSSTPLHGHRNLMTFGRGPGGGGFGYSGGGSNSSGNHEIGDLATPKDEGLRDGEAGREREPAEKAIEKIPAPKPDRYMDSKPKVLVVRKPAKPEPLAAPAPLLRQALQGQDLPDRLSRIEREAPVLAPKNQPTTDAENGAISGLETRRRSIIKVVRDQREKDHKEADNRKLASELPEPSIPAALDGRLVLNDPDSNRNAEPGWERAGKLEKRGSYGYPSSRDEAAKRPADATIMGSLDKNAIQQVIRGNLGPVQACYERALQSNPNSGGKVRLSFTIQPDGNVSDATGEGDDAELGRCVAQQARRWSFPAPKGGGVVRVTYPFVFRSAGEEEGSQGEDGASHLAEPPETPLDQLSFIPARGYFENTYLPGDPEIEWLRERLAQLPGGTAFDWIDAIRPYRQPFDAPAFDGLAVYLAADRKGVEGPARLTLQVGIKGSLRHAQRRSAVTAALVVDLRQVPDEASRRSLWTLADAMAGELQAGDRFFLVAAGVERPLKLKSSEFTSLAVRRALADALEEREAKGVQGSLEGALQAAYDAVRGEGAVDSSLGANLVLLIGAGEIGENIDRLSVLAHTRAVDGIGLTALGVGGGVDADGLRELALSGQGRFRMVEAGAERRTIESELAASGSVVARAVRLRIRLMPGVKLISVLGSRPLEAVEADRVRQAEQAIDQRVSRILGIEADRGEDEDGIQIVVPAFFAGDDHVILLDVVVPGPGLVADVRARYKDLVNLKNAVSQASLVLAAGERPLDPLSLNVKKNVLAFDLAQDLRQAAERLDAGQVDGAVQTLRLAQARIGWLLRKTPELKGDPELNRDREALASMRAELEERIAEGSADAGELAIPLAYSGRAKLPPRRTLKEASQEGIR